MLSFYSIKKNNIDFSDMVINIAMRKISDQYDIFPKIG